MTTHGQLLARILAGGRGNDTLGGGEGFDYLEGNDGVTTILEWATRATTGLSARGHDTLMAGVGSDTLSGLGGR